MIDDASSAAVVLVLEDDVTEQQIGMVRDVCEQGRFPVFLAAGDGWKAMSVGDGVRPVPLQLSSLPGVRSVVPVPTPYRLSSRGVHAPTSVAVLAAPDGRHHPRSGSLRVGERYPIVVAAAMSTIPPADGATTLARSLSAHGVRWIHAGALPPNGGSADHVERLAQLHALTAAIGMVLSVEISDAREVQVAANVADVLVLGSRNMQDFRLLQVLGRSTAPVLLRRGHGATIEEFLLAAEYVLSNGNGRLMLCESGIHTFDDPRTPRFEINAVPLLKLNTHLPVLADPTATLADPAQAANVAGAAIAAGADGVFVHAPSDAMFGPDDTAVPGPGFQYLNAVAGAVDRTVAASEGGPT